MTSSDFIKVLNRPRLLDAATLRQLTELLRQYPYCQSLRMIHLKNIYNTDKHEYQKVLKETAALFPDRKKLFALIHHIEEKHPIDEVGASSFLLDSSIDNEESVITNQVMSHEDTSKDEIIQRFIDQAPSVRPVFTDETEDEEEKIELHSDTDFITESLAEIYIRKGHYKDAIKIYKKLSLKYPKKNTYFASQIENLNKIS